jgi:hypothetical protein
LTSTLSAKPLRTPSLSSYKDKKPMSQFDSRLTIAIHLHEDRVTS